MANYTPGGFGYRRTSENDDEEYEVFPLHHGEKPSIGCWSPIAEKIQTDHDDFPERALANARLFAASDKILEALEGLVLASKPTASPKDLRESLTRARRAIRLAKEGGRR